MSTVGAPGRASSAAVREKTKTGRVAVLAVGIALAVGGCSSGTEHAGGSSGPTNPAGAGGPTASATKSAASDRALTKWAGRMCEATKRFTTMKKESALDVEEISNPPGDALIGPEFVAMGYLSSTSTALDEVAQNLGRVRPSGIAAADRLHDRLSQEVERVRPKVAALTDHTVGTSPAETSVTRAGQVGKLIDSLKMPQPDLTAVVAEEPRLSAAYRTAPECAPPEPLPEAADGTDLAACEDGSCEVLVTKQVHVTVGTWQLRVSPTETRATVRNVGPDGGLGEITLGTGGSGTFGESNGGKVTVRALGVDADGAVLKFSTT